MSITLIHPAPDSGWAGQRLDDVLRLSLAGREVRAARRAEELSGLAGQRLLLALPLGDTGVNLEYMRMLARLRKEPELLRGCTAGLVVDGAGELFTKSAAAEAALALNMAGCALVGRPLVEGTGSLVNFAVQAKNLGAGLMGAYHHAVQELAGRVEEETFPKRERPQVLVLHASSHHTSNTIDLWSSVREKLEGRCTIREIGLRNGTLFDCSGCPYTMCLHFGEQGGCFYGGPMVEEVFPAVRACDAMVMLCANYNDALAANLTAFVNRLTALFRQNRFYEKRLFALIVSGYSGGDLIARQLISGLNMNKSFYLPPRFCMLETANDRGSLVKLPGIAQRGALFAGRIMGAS